MMKIINILLLHILLLLLHIKTHYYYIAIIVPNTYRNVSDCKICFAHKMSSQAFPEFVSVFEIGVDHPIDVQRKLQLIGLC